MKRSELIKILMEQIDKQGDGDVYLESYDYKYGCDFVPLIKIVIDEDNDTILSPYMN